MFTPSTGRCAAACEPREAADRGIRPAVVEAHAVDERAVGDEPEQPRALVAGLGDGGERSDLDVPEAELAEPGTAWPSLSNPAATPNGDGNRRPSVSTASEGSGRVNALDEASEAERRQHPDDPEREVVRVFGVHAGEDEGKRSRYMPRLRLSEAPCGR